MNKKLKLYSTLFIVALIVSIFVSIVKFEKYSYASSEDTRLEYVEEPSEYVLSDKVNDEGKVIEKNHKPELAFTICVVWNLSRVQMPKCSCRSRWDSDIR